MGNYLRKYQIDEVFDVAKFIINENLNHHKVASSKQSYLSDIHALCDEELTYSQNAEVYVERDQEGSILGSIRVLQWNCIDPLPIQKIFGITPLNHINLNTVNQVFHFGRLAIQKDCPSLQLFKKLIAIAIAPVCKHPQNVAFAECDSKLLRVLTLLGIEVQPIGNAIHYLGSDTIPVMFSYAGLIDFHLKTKQTINE